MLQAIAYAQRLSFNPRQPICSILTKDVNVGVKEPPRKVRKSEEKLKERRPQSHKAIPETPS
jgi:hypothetical protein